MFTNVNYLSANYVDVNLTLPTTPPLHSGGTLLSSQPNGITAIWDKPLRPLSVPQSYLLFHFYPGIVQGRHCSALLLILPYP